MKSVTGFILLVLFFLQCSRDEGDQKGYHPMDEASLETALADWPEMPQQIAFTGLKDCPTKFQVYWNGALSCFVGRDCFGHVFPPQEDLTRSFEKDQLHLTFAGGRIPVFPVIDSGQVEQSLLDGYLPVLESAWSTGQIHYTVKTLASSARKEDLDPGKTAGMAMAFIEVTVEAPPDMAGDELPFWLNFSGYRVLVPTDKELPEDVFPPYGSDLHLDGNILYDQEHRVRIALLEAPDGTQTRFHKVFPLPPGASEELERSARKGFLKNLMQLSIPCKAGQKAKIILALPYFPTEPEQLDLAGRDYGSELESVKQYWAWFYKRDTPILTPDEFVNNFYRSGLWRTLVTADWDEETGMIYAKSSPAWYETLWPNCTMVSAVSLMQRGHPDISAGYLEPFLGWQSVRNPPNMKGASREGFLCPPEAYCAIPWVSNHGNILWALCEQYRFTGDSLWARKISPVVLKAADWIISQRKLTLMMEQGAGLLPGGTVSDDKGAGQYLCSDAQNYRGLKSAAAFLKATRHPRAPEIGLEASAYREDIRKALEKSMENKDSVRLADGSTIPYVPAEISQAAPPAFDPGNYWPYINYIDVGPMNLVDCHVLESNSAMANAILRFESAYPIAYLDHPVSLTENWVHSIKYKGDEPAFLLHRGVSTIEPFYAPRATMFLENDDIEAYVSLFYNQLAAGVSHKNLTPCENRYGVWQMPWADGEFHRILLQMLICQENDTLTLLKAIPRKWLENEKEISLGQQATAFGTLGFSVKSHLDEGLIDMQITSRLESAGKKIHIRFRHPEGRPITAVLRDGLPFEAFDEEYVYLESPSSNTGQKTELKIFFK